MVVCDSATILFVFPPESLKFPNAQAGQALAQACGRACSGHVQWFQMKYDRQPSEWLQFFCFSVIVLLGLSKIQGAYVLY